MDMISSESNGTTVKQFVETVLRLSRSGLKLCELLGALLLGLRGFFKLLSQLKLLCF